MFSAGPRLRADSPLPTRFHTSRRAPRRSAWPRRPRRARSSGVPPRSTGPGRSSWRRARTSSPTGGCRRSSRTLSRFRSVPDPSSSGAASTAAPRRRCRCGSGHTPPPEEVEGRGCTLRREGVDDVGGEPVSGWSARNFLVARSGSRPTPSSMAAGSFISVGNGRPEPSRLVQPRPPHVWRTPAGQAFPEDCAHARAVARFCFRREGRRLRRRDGMVP